MRSILFVSCFYASDFGDVSWGPFIRMRMLVEAASRAAARVDLLLFAADDVIASADVHSIAATIERAWGFRVNVILAPRRPNARSTYEQLTRFVRSLIDVRNDPDYGRASSRASTDAIGRAVTDETDLVVAQKLESALPVAACAPAGVALVMDIDDVEHVAFSRRTRQLPASLGKLVRQIRIPALTRGENDTIDAFDTCLVCSENDRKELMRRPARARIEVVPNAIHFPASAILERRRANQTILYFGSYAYQPNVDAAEELIHSIFPQVLARCPDAQLLIVGAFADRLPSFAKTMPSTRVVGFVADVADIYLQTAMACCPIRAGGGTRIKIIEACAWQIPTVSTRVAAEGLDLAEGDEIMFAETPEDLARHCVALLRDPVLAASIGTAARRKAQSRYDREEVIDRVAAIYRKTFDSAPRGGSS